MEERNDGEKVEELMLPGFRFHPTDEELVAFYLKRKIQQRPLLIELIKQIDIYKYDPWDLPKLGGSGEKEWYFYCPRDRKYRNSARPNRVTGAGFWKATGTDRPIYSSDHGNKCIGLKKSLVFYKGRAAKGLKTDWMMHEFRLPSLTDHPPPSTTKRFLDKTIPANDSWAICRIFKKTNSTAQRALSLSSIVPPLSETNTSDNNANFMTKNNNNNNDTYLPSSSSFETLNQLSSISNNNNNNNTYPFDHHFFSSCKPFNTQTITNNRSALSHHLPTLAEPPSYNTDQPAAATTTCRSVDLSSILLNMSSSVLGDFGIKQPSSSSSTTTTTTTHQDTIDLLHAQQQHYFTSNNNNNYPPQSNFSHDHHHHHDHQMHAGGDQFGVGYPNLMSFPFHNISESSGIKSSFVWDSSSSCPSEVSTSLSTTNCYT